MNLAQFGKACGKFSGAKLVVQWGGSHVYKIGPKMFAAGMRDAGGQFYIFKTTAFSFEILREQGMAIRAPYLTCGNWLRVNSDSALPDTDLAGYLQQSYEIVAASLTKITQQELGLL